MISCQLVPFYIVLLLFHSPYRISKHSGVRFTYLSENIPRHKCLVFNLKEKSESNPHLLKQNFHELQSYYSDHEHIYTDGSKDEEKVGCAAAKLTTVK